MVSRRQRPASDRAHRRRFGFGDSYRAALAASVLASLLTLLYVGGGVPESNPVVASLIARIGLLETMVLRTLVLVGCFWAYAVVARAVGRPRLATAFGWLGALVNLLDAGGNVLAAAVVGVPPGSVTPSAALFVAALFPLAAALRPPGPGESLSLAD